MRTCLKPLLFTTITCLHGGHTMMAQGRVFHGEPAGPGSPREVEYDASRLAEGLVSWSLYALDPAALHAEVAHRSGTSSITLRLGDEHLWHLDIWKNDLLAPDHVCLLATDEGVIELPPVEPFTYSGWLSDRPDSRVRFSILEGSFVGSVRHGSEVFIIEPVSAFDPEAPADLYVVYDARDVIATVGASCGTVDRDEDLGVPDTGGPMGMQDCRTARIALAADHSMVSNYAGSVENARRRLLTVMNQVDDFYRDYRIEIAYEVAAIFISNSTAADPWSTSNDSPTLLGSFRTWGNNGGFGPGVSYAVASLWTRRDIANSGNTAVIGEAYMGAVCGTNRYNINEQSSMTASIWLPAICQAHELGHNWNAQHPSSSDRVHIMSASISEDNTEWDNGAISRITAHKSSRNCLLGTCPPPGTIGMDEIADGGGLIVSPNPSNGRFLVEWNTAMGRLPHHFEVWDALGRRVSGVGVAGRSSVDLDVDAGPGLYLLRSLDRDGNLLGTYRLVRY